MARQMLPQTLSLLLVTIGLIWNLGCNSGSNNSMVGAGGSTDQAFIAHAAKLARTVDFADAPWKSLADALKAATGRKGRGLFMPLRLALTGRDSGPEMAPLLDLIGRDRTLVRLDAAAGPRSQATCPD